MSICTACHDYFDPDDYLQLCNACGRQLTKQYDALQEFRGGVMTIAELTSWATFGRRPQPERCWVVG